MGKISSEAFFKIRKREANEYEKQRKKERKWELDAQKEIILNEIEKYLIVFGESSPIKTLFSKVKNARTSKSVQKHYELFQKEKENFNNLSKKERRKIIYKNKNIKKGIGFSEWMILPQDRKHPAPKCIMEAKVESGLSWNAFEEELQISLEKERINKKE